MDDRPGRQLGLLWGGVALALVALSPLARFFAGEFLSCPLKSLAGIPCPTCGTTRAALALAQLEPLHALVHYPLPTLGWITFLAGGFFTGWRALRHEPLPAIPRRLPLWGKIALGAALLANWVYSIATGV